jgi:hypothetical protein
MTDLFLLAVVASLDAGLIAAAVVLLAQPNPAAKLLAYLIGGIGFSIGFGLVIVFALHGSSFLSHPSRSTIAGVELAAGALLLVVAAIAFTGRTVHWRPRGHRSDHASPLERAIGRDSLWIAWAAGAVYSLPGASYLAGLALLVKLNRTVPTDALAVVVFNVVMFAFIELPLVGFLVAPDRTRRLASRLDDWMSRHKRMLVVVVAGIAGAYLLSSGLSDLS